MGLIGPSGGVTRIYYGGERIYENDEASVTGRDQGRDEYLSQVMRQGVREEVSLREVPSSKNIYYLSDKVISIIFPFLIFLSI